MVAAVFLSSLIIYESKERQLYSFTGQHKRLVGDDPVLLRMQMSSWRLRQRCMKGEMPDLMIYP